MIKHYISVVNTLLFNSIEKEYEDNFIILTGLSTNNLIDDIRRIYRIDITQSSKVTMFFTVSNSGVMFKKSALKFHKYFALEMYFMFDRLYTIVKRSMYYEASKLLMEEPNVAKYFTELLPLPESVTNVLDSLAVPLFPFQRQFMESYYNARNKLGLHGYILAFEAGLGKTFTAIAAVYAFKLWPAIITAPRATLDGWKKSIVEMIKDCKPEEVKISYEYNPNKDKVPWKFFVCNFERLDQALDYSKYAVSKPNAVLIDECHNFRYMDTRRVQSLLNLKKQLDIENVIAISGTPIKALASELIPVIKLLDPEFDDYAENIFRRIYSRSTYDPISGSSINKRLSLMLERRKQEESIKLPPLEKYSVIVKLKNPKPYIIEQVKEDVWKYVEEHTKEYQQEVQPNYQKVLSILDSDIITSNVDHEELFKYKDAVKMKMENPLDNKSLEQQSFIKHFEIDVIRNISRDIYKELLVARRNCTVYTKILLGKAMGIYFTRNKINLICDMVKENVDEIAKIIREGEMKTIIFSTFIEPLTSVKESLESIGIGCVLHTGQSDIRETRTQFKEDDSKQVFLGTVGAVGTGKYNCHMI